MYEVSELTKIYEIGKVKIKDLLTAASAKTGEKIQLRRFARYEVGKD